jgi:hypothetical protein
MLDLRNLLCGGAWAVRMQEELKAGIEVVLYEATNSICR